MESGASKKIYFFGECQDSSVSFLGVHEGKESVKLLYSKGFSVLSRENKGGILNAKRYLVSVFDH
jgi:hypothetical protein